MRISINDISNEPIVPYKKSVKNDKSRINVNIYSVWDVIHCMLGALFEWKQHIHFAMHDK